MIWPNATDYNAAVQNPQLCFRDDDLRQGQAVGDLFGLPRPHSGNFADVYQIQAADGQSWAVKCFTRPAAGLRPRYHAICEHLRHTQRAFMVEFHYLDEGICIRGQWHPMVKMRWVEGFRLNEFVREHLNKPALLDRLAQLWLRLAQDLRDSDMAHGDLQHGNVLLVPGGKGSSLSLKLIDYDGMFVPSLADHPSGEVGHPHYQHPRRLREGGYGRDMDRFAHLLIYAALRCLRIGGDELWQRYDNLENLLFREEDFRQPNRSRLLHELWEMRESEVRGLVGHLLLASQGALEAVPELDELVDDSGIRPLSDDEEARINDLLKDAAPSRDRSSFRGSRNGRTKSQTAVRAVAALTDTNPILLDEKTIESPVPALPRTPRRSAAEIELDAQPPTPAVDRSPFEVAVLTDPLVAMLSHPVWLATLGAIALVSFLVINLMMWSSVKEPTTAAIRRPTLAEIGEVALKSGFKKSIALDVERHASQGPLTLRIEGLPDELKVPPLTLPANEDRISLTLLAPLGIVLPPCAARVSLWEGDDKVDEKTMHLSVQAVPRPLLKAADKIACEVGHAAEFVFIVERNNCREPLLARLDGLPPQVRQESAAAANADRLSVKLSVAADLTPQAIPLKLRLHLGDVIADSKELLLNIQEHTSPKRLEREQIARVRINDETPKSLAVEAGAKGQLRIFLDHGEYKGEVQVQLTDLPNGVTAQPTVVPATDAAIVTVETMADAGIGEHRVHLLVRVNKQTVDRRELTLSVSRPRGQQERVHFSTLDHMQLAGTLYHGWRGKRGMTVLMLHDLRSNRSSPGWKRLAEALQAEGHTVLTFDFRGHGDSKKVSPRFWNYSVNKYLPAHEPGLPAERQPRTLEAEIPSGYMPWLIEDIAAARTYLDLRHDDPAGPVNTFNLIVVGAGQASALGSLWLATEGLRYNGSDVGNKILLKWPEKLSVLQAVWIGMADPLKLRPFGIHVWLEGAHAKPAVPITFIYGEDDVDTSTLLSLPIREKHGKPVVIRNTRLSGQQLLDADAQSAARIQQYLVKTLQKLPPVDWVPRKIKTLRSFWKIPLSLPGGREQERWFVAKRPGEETLMPVPFQPLNIPPIKGLAEPTSFVPEQSEP